MLLAQALDIVSGSLRAKWFGASRWGAVGGILGAIVRLFFGIIGLFVGPLIGAFAGELLGGKASCQPESPHGARCSAPRPASWEAGNRRPHDHLVHRGCGDSVDPRVEPF